MIHNTQSLQYRLIELTGEIQKTLRYLSEVGCRGFDCSNESLDIMERWDGESLDEIREDITQCRKCRLSKERKNVVVGAGNPKAKLIFVGDAPGNEDDEQGEPFVGEVGELLTNIIKAMNLTRNDVYICNIVKCHPPGNRNPALDELSTCLPFFERQIAVIKPKWICALGPIAAQKLIGSNRLISELRGKFYPYKDSKLIATYHPAYLLRNTDKKRDTWEDIKKLIQEYGQQ